MKKVLLILLSVYMVESSAATALFSVLESVPASASSATSSKESSEIDSYIESHAVSAKKSKVLKKQKKIQAINKNKKPLKKNKANKAIQVKKYDQSYDVNAVFLQQQEQANKIIEKSNQINSAAQQVARDAAIQSQKTQVLLRAQKSAQDSANATISSANQLNKLSMSLQKDINSKSTLESGNQDFIEVEGDSNQ